MSAIMMFLRRFLSKLFDFKRRFLSGHVPVSTELFNESQPELSANPPISPPTVPLAASSGETMGESLPESVSERLIELSEGRTTDKLVANRVQDEGANNSDLLDDKSVTELVTSAQAGFAPAQFDLAVMYDYGLYVEENAELAFDWYRKAAQQGLSEAQNAVAVMYDSGRGVARNTREALSWYELAVENGN
ncbi:MAG: tetratricopeptide repeat protein [Neisseria sp.]|nr:tetratricopeptide repeat protein [Neisseria sp.]